MLKRFRQQITWKSVVSFAALETVALLNHTVKLFAEDAYLSVLKSLYALRGAAWLGHLLSWSADHPVSTTAIVCLGFLTALQTVAMSHTEKKQVTPEQNEPEPNPTEPETPVRSPQLPHGQPNIVRMLAGITYVEVVGEYNEVRRKPSAGPHKAHLAAFRNDSVPGRHVADARQVRARVTIGRYSVTGYWLDSSRVDRVNFIVDASAQELGKL